MIMQGGSAEIDMPPSTSEVREDNRVAGKLASTPCINLSGHFYDAQIASSSQSWTVIHAYHEAFP